VGAVIILASYYGHLNGETACHIERKLVKRTTMTVELQYSWYLLLSVKRNYTVRKL
jgi:hypothetical protein